MLSCLSCFSFFFFNDPATTEIYTLPLHDALPISRREVALLNLLRLVPFLDLARLFQRQRLADQRRRVGLPRPFEGGFLSLFDLKADLDVILLRRVGLGPEDKEEDIQVFPGGEDLL